MDGRRRIEIARTSLARLVKDHLKPDDREKLFTVTGNGDVLEPDDQVLAIGSGASGLY